MKTLLWISARGRRFGIFVLKFFLPYFFYIAVRNLFHREKEGKFLILEEPIPRLYENRRLVSVAGTSTFFHYLRCLRDGFPDDERFQFGWGEFQASGSQSLFVFPDFLEKKKVFFSMETPIMGRHYFNDLATQAKGYFRVGLHGSVTLHRSEYNLPSKVDNKRLKAILHKTRTSLKSYKKHGKHILYPLQMPSDTNLLGLNPFEAAQYDLITLRCHTSRPIVVTVKPHMVREKWAANRISLLDESKVHYHCLKELCHRLGVIFYDDFKKEGTDSSMFLKDCWCVVCHSVTFAVDAMLAGVPVITLHPANFVYPICSHDLSEVENPKMPDRIPWFSRLAYCQWTLEEIARGDAWRHFQPSVERLLEKKKI